MIKFNNLDEGYNQCANLYNFVKDRGDKIITNLNMNISDLEKHWQGDDATLHINGIIKVFNGLIQFVNSTIIDTSFAAEKIIEVQRVRRANGGNSMVGDSLPKADISYEKKTEINGTNEYNCDPAAKSDYSNLVQICNDFESFSNTVVNYSEELMQNWIDGNGRVNVNNNFNEFRNNSDSYKKILSNAKESLNIAITNISTIMD